MKAHSDEGCKSAATSDDWHSPLQEKWKSFQSFSPLCYSSRSPPYVWTRLKNNPPKDREPIGAVVVVKWSACSTSTPTIQVRILPTSTVFSVKFVFEKNENKQKRPGLAHFFKKIGRLELISSSWSIWFDQGNQTFKMCNHQFARIKISIRSAAYLKNFINKNYC